ncbi:MAG TPA: c-type cytochrome biogenesis protein CcmI [Methylocella sp.]|nr:c-type cytochrome biogenesis protein CcmI [Methylocella sp.]
MLWFIFALLTFAAAASVLWPLSRSPRRPSREGMAVAFYKAQLAEIERDEAQGFVATEEARAAKAEAGRRLLAMAEAPVETESAAQPRTGRLIFIVPAIFIPALSLSLYALIGHPELPDAPLSARLSAAPEQLDVAMAVAKIEAHLAQHPADGRGYEILVPVYLRLGRGDAAVHAAHEALRLLGPTADRLAAYGETLVFAANGAVTAEAKESFEAAVAKDAEAAKPRFFLGLAAAQGGDAPKAREIWSRLIAEAPPNTPWADALRERMAALGAGAGEPQGRTAQIAALPAPEQMAKIRGMVDGLAARLAQNGHDLDGWLRLVRSYTVLQEKEKARLALDEAKRNLAGDAGAIARIEALARELGLES